MGYENSQQFRFFLRYLVLGIIQIVYLIILKRWATVLLRFKKWIFRMNISLKRFFPLAHITFTIYNINWPHHSSIYWQQLMDCRLVSEKSLVLNKQAIVSKWLLAIVLSLFHHNIINKTTVNYFLLYVFGRKGDSGL